MKVEKPSVSDGQGTQCIGGVVVTKELEQKRGGGGVKYDDKFAKKSSQSGSLNTKARLGKARALRTLVSMLFE